MCILCICFHKCNNTYVQVCTHECLHVWVCVRVCPLLSARSFACQLARKCNDVDWRRSLRDDTGVFMYVCVYVCKCLSRNVLEQKVAFSLITCGLSTTIQQMIITLVKHNQHDVYTHTTTCKCVCIAVISAAWAFEYYHLCKQQQQ